MRRDKPADAGRQVMVAAAMGHPGEGAGGLLDALIRGLDMPRGLSAVGIGPEHFDRSAERAMTTPWVPRNPRRIDAPARVREILELAARRGDGDRGGHRVAGARPSGATPPWRLGRLGPVRPNRRPRPGAVAH